MSSSSEDGAALQQFCLLAKSAKGAGCASLIGQALEHPGIFVFGELLDMPSIKELAGTAAAPHLELLKLFAWGTWSDYKSRAAQLPALSEAQAGTAAPAVTATLAPALSTTTTITPSAVTAVTAAASLASATFTSATLTSATLTSATLPQASKLKMLSVVSLSSKSKLISYDELMREIEISSVREVEDLLPLPRPLPRPRPLPLPSPLPLPLPLTPTLPRWRGMRAPR